VYLLEQSGLSVLTNPTGSNFTRGIYATIIKYSGLFGGMDYDIAVLELDEAYSRIFAKQYPPRMVLALNVMRDQLDRYGEIDKTAQMIGDAIAQSTEGAVLNMDDDRVESLKNFTTGVVTYFGVTNELREHLPTDDEMHLHHAPHYPKRKKHHKKHHQSNVESDIPSNVILSHYKPGSVGYLINGKIYHSAIRIAGIHNAFNIAAALAVTLRVCPDMEPQFLVPTIKDIPAAFGRGEVISVEDKRLTLALVKNPSGFRQSIASYESSLYDCVAFVINDNFADGRDVSWLWDVNFDDLDPGNKKITSGSRGADMQLRLKYDEFESELINPISAMVDKILQSDLENALIFCTYTSMLEIRSILGAKTDVEDVW
jgi:UDP-N-acetylmuramyl tripeptide synthase